MQEKEFFQLKSWIPVEQGSDFPLQNLPFGIFSTHIKTLRAATRIGHQIIDLYELSRLLDWDQHGFNPRIFLNPYLNDFISLGKDQWQWVRQQLIEVFKADSPWKEETKEFKYIMHDVEDVQMHLPVRIGDYTDFYSSMEHATNVGTMFRDPNNALLPNWKHLPVAYHGRSSSIVVSGTHIHRPKGQLKPSDDQPPVFGPSKQFDFELEMAFIIGKDTQLGETVRTEAAMDHIFGMVIFNDLSARDIQKWEYVPLGPFLSKNFGSVISPWIVTMDALKPFSVESPAQDPEVLPYLRYEGMHSYDINLEVELFPEKGSPSKVCHSNYKYLYWNMVQQLAHHTVNGCNIRVGDMYASGTISGPTPDSYGSMLELTWKGTKPIELSDGSKRSFIHDGDSIRMKAYAEKHGVRVGFGESLTKVLPAKS